MQRVIAIALMLVYLVTSSGVAWSKFYCCGKLKETSLFLNTAEKKSCKANDKEDGCCNTQTYFVKVTDDHAPSCRVLVDDAAVIIHANTFSSLLPVPETIASATVTSFSPLPPEHIYIGNCIFRI
jgi:hypothetical protein